MSMTEVVEESLKADARFRHLTVSSPKWTQEMLEKTQAEADRLWKELRFEMCPSWDEIHGDNK